MSDVEASKQKSIWKRLLLWLFFLGALPVLALLIYAALLYPKLPDASSLKEVTFKVPLKIVTADHKLITEIGTEKRIPLKYTEIPERMTQAIVSAEDEHFFEHHGVDLKGLARAVFELITTGHKKSGGSTITMQVARNFFLTKKKSYLRKFKEILLAIKIEQELSKPEILALYLNKIFLGYRSYGVAAAAQTYYGKPIDQLSLDEYAMIAGLPKAPSAYNPIANPERAKIRRNYVLRRMYENGYITEAEMKAAQAVPIHAKLSGARIEVRANYVAEMARHFAIQKFGPDALTQGLTLVTTINSTLQNTANQAVANGLQAYERRHGYRGPITHLSPTQLIDTEQVKQTLDQVPTYANLKVGVVTNIAQEMASILLKDGQTIQLTLETLKWARPFISVNKKGPEPKKMADILHTGDVIYVIKEADQWQLAQNPTTESALISLRSSDGAIQALVGGYDYFRSKFNRVIQARRQVGSNIKPFLYSAALHKGYTAASTINDAPVVFHDSALEDIWRPENYSGRFYGPTRLRKALAYSRNLVSIRLLRQIGIPYAIEYIHRFGFPLEELNKHRDLSLALGSVQFTPWEVVRGYATFSNTGFLIEPYFVKTILDNNGNPIYQALPKKACQNQCNEADPHQAKRVISPQNAYIITSLMQDVIRYGSGRKANILKRLDIAGKTGTTNDQKDAWFSGFNPDITTTVWVGFDQPATLGRREVGGRAALPIWIDYMRVALKDSPNRPFARPAGLVNIPIDKQSGKAVPADTPGAIFEVFRKEHAPKIPNVREKKLEEMTQELFE
ncbi:penicillin-binding protein 1A [Galenea microaerophila]